MQFVKAIVGESSLKGFDVLKADARERRMCDVNSTCTVHVPVLPVVLSLSLN